MNSSLLVNVDSISRRYGRLQAITAISFVINKGEVLGFLGPNGAGKSTTMQIISGNLAPTDGHITIAGHDLLEHPRAAKAVIGYLPEHPPVYRDFTVDEYLNYCAALRNVPRKQRAITCARAKERCGLQDVGRRLIGNLSRGFQQRVGLAQAILHSPLVIILDEPTVGLDPIQIREIRALIREFGKDHGIILSTHILSEVQAICDRVQIINHGRLILSDTIAGLSRHLQQSSSLVVAFRSVPDLTALAQIPGVTLVTAIENDRIRVTHTSDSGDPTDAIVKLATEKNWGLYAINAEHASLEEVFVALTKNEAPSHTTPNP